MEKRKHIQNGTDSVASRDNEMDAIARQIIEALDLGNYTVSFEEPNCVFEQHHPDGSTFYVVRNMDGPRSSTDAGTCYVNVEGFQFNCCLNNGEWISYGGFNLSDYPEVVDALESAEGVISGEHISIDEMITVYEAANKCNCDEYYFDDWDEEIPKDIEEMLRLEACDLEKCGEYYLLEEIQDADSEHDGKRWARAALDEPDIYGKYQCVILLFDENGNQIGQMDCNDEYYPESELFN